MFVDDFCRGELFIHSPDAGREREQRGQDYRITFHHLSLNWFERFAICAWNEPKKGENCDVLALVKRLLNRPSDFRRLTSAQTGCYAAHRDEPGHKQFLGRSC